jgi:hypothetical protein
MAKLTAPALAFPLQVSLATALPPPTVVLQTLENPPQPVLLELRMHARLVVINPNEASPSW